MSLYQSFTGQAPPEQSAEQEEIAEPAPAKPKVKRRSKMDLSLEELLEDPATIQKLEDHLVLGGMVGVTEYHWMWSTLGEQCRQKALDTSAPIEDRKRAAWTLLAMNGVHSERPSINLAFPLPK
jgi:hypothetical protein